jgi:hypothetical protein
VSPCLDRVTLWNRNGSFLGDVLVLQVRPVPLAPPPPHALLHAAQVVADLLAKVATLAAAAAALRVLLVGDLFGEQPPQQVRGGIGPRHELRSSKHGNFVAQTSNLTNSDYSDIKRFYSNISSTSRRCVMRNRSLCLRLGPRRFRRRCCLGLPSCDVSSFSVLL